MYRATYNSLPSSADTGRDPPDSIGELCLPVPTRPGLKEEGDVPRLEWGDCDVSGLLPDDLGVLCLLGGELIDPVDDELFISSVSLSEDEMSSERLWRPTD